VGTVFLECEHKELQRPKMSCKALVFFGHDFANGEWKSETPLKLNKTRLFAKK
jgi:hypothetical protein